MDKKKKIVIFISIFIVFVTTVWVLSGNRKNTNHTEQQTMQLEYELTQLEVKFAANTGFFNDNEIEIAKIRAAAYDLKNRAPIKVYSRINALIKKCNDQL